MKINVGEVRKCLKAFDFMTLFYEHLGWDKHQAHLDIPVDGNTVSLTAIAQKRGFVAFVCRSMLDRPTRLKVDHQVTKSVREHFVIYADKPSGQQVWHWVRREAGKPLASRDHRFDVSQSGDPLIQRLERIAVSMQEEEALTLPDIAGRNREAFDVDKVTRKFYERFKAEHSAFLKLIRGFPAPVKVDDKSEPHPDLQWYTSLMLNRLMFIYFIQKKGFLDGDTDYLRNRLAMVKQFRGKDKFQSFYRYFLLRLFHDGLGKSLDERQLDPTMEKFLGKVPYLNGGFFEVHKLEIDYPETDIPDQAFEKLFGFFDLYSWHLDERPCRVDNEINPDVVGFIFEKYVNQKQMGAYYTKEDITEYISKSTIIPYLFDAARKKCAIAFKPDSALWRLLRDDPDRYIYPAVGHGVTCDYDRINHRNHKRLAVPLSLPADIEAGVKDVSKRDGWSKLAPEAYGLPTETWREVVARRQRCMELREKLSKGEIHEVNDLITLNLDIWQFARDAIINAEGPELLRAFWHAIAGRMPEKSDEKIEPGITILDPTCGSGAFLFAALRVLETLYSDCLERMERFVEDLAGKPHHPEQYSDFRKVLDQIDKHPSDRYFILKSIMINNLFGVDIMEEAVEICKLRLFLKLVAQVETVDQIEPLPDIDFNIRAGNTLVGFASLEQVRSSQKGTLGFGKDQVSRIEEDAQIASQAFRQFRLQQVRYGGRVAATDKKELSIQLRKLDAELDRYLAGEHGISVTNRQDFAAWQGSHVPFHWFTEFYSIMHSGGFDIIIGNPPYINTQKVTKSYRVLGLATVTCPDIYACFIERTLSLLTREGRCGLITPISLSFSSDFTPLRELIFSSSPENWFSSFARIPAALFSAETRVRNTIWIAGKTQASPSMQTTRLHRWFEDARPTLFQSIEYAHCTPSIWNGTIPKAAPTSLVAAFEKHARATRQVIAATLSTCPTRHILYWKKTAYNWLNCCRKLPPSYDAQGMPLDDVNYGEMYFADAATRDLAFVVLNSSVLFLYWCIRGDDLNVPRWVFADFPFDLAALPEGTRTRLLNLTCALERAMVEATSFKLNAGKRVGNYNLAKCRPVTRQIDLVVCDTMGLDGETDALERLYGQMVKTDYEDSTEE